MEKRPVRPKSAPPRPLEQADLDGLVVQGLEFLSRDPARLDHFFQTTGLSPATLRAAASEPSFRASFLDYLTSDEALLRAFAQASGIDPAEVDVARARLSGPAEPA